MLKLAAYLRDRSLGRLASMISISAGLRDLLFLIELLEVDSLLASMSSSTAPFSTAELETEKSLSTSRNYMLSNILFTRNFLSPNVIEK